MKNIIKSLGTWLIRFGFERMGGDIPEQCLPVAEIETGESWVPLIFTTYTRHSREIPMDYVKKQIVRDIAKGISEHVHISTEVDLPIDVTIPAHMRLLISTGRVAVMPIGFLARYQKQIQ